MESPASSPDAKGSKTGHIASETRKACCASTKRALGNTRNREIVKSNKTRSPFFTSAAALSKNCHSERWVQNGEVLYPLARFPPWIKIVWDLQLIQHPTNNE